MIDFDRRLKSLKERRQGAIAIGAYDSTLSFSERHAVLGANNLNKSESYESLRESAGIKYTIGAMAPVDPKSTKISIDEGNRVADNLIDALNKQGEYAIKKLQGSVALDIHIKGHSDVDMLIINSGTVNIELPTVATASYLPATDPRSVLDIVKDLRKKSEVILPSRFPATHVDINGNKSISLSGGSLQRKIDIVPAIWFDSCVYQSSGKECDRGVKIYDKSNHTLLPNFPFLHIKIIDDRDSLFSGNLKCVIRLLKNMIADMPDYKKNIAKRLSSYDLAAIAYHMNQDLQMLPYMRLGLVEKTRSHLHLILASPSYRNLLMVPDQTRRIFDNENKVEALEILSREMDDLAISIYKDIRPFSTTYEPSTILHKAVYPVVN